MHAAKARVVHSASSYKSQLLEAAKELEDSKKSECHPDDVKAVFGATLQKSESEKDVIMGVSSTSSSQLSSQLVQEKAKLVSENQKLKKQLQEQKNILVDQKSRSRKTLANITRTTFEHSTERALYQSA